MGGGEGELEAVSTPRVKGLGPHLSTIRSMQLCQELQVRPPPPRPPRPAPLACTPPRPPATPARASARVLLPAATRHGRKCLSWGCAREGRGRRGPRSAPRAASVAPVGSSRADAPRSHPTSALHRRAPLPRGIPPKLVFMVPLSKHALPPTPAAARASGRSPVHGMGRGWEGGGGWGAGSPSLWGGSVQRPRGPHAAAPSVGRSGAPGGGHPAGRAPT